MDAESADNITLKLCTYLGKLLFLCDWVERSARCSIPKEIVVTSYKSLVKVLKRDHGLSFLGTQINRWKFSMF